MHFSKNNEKNSENGITIRKVDGEDRPWLVNVAKTCFGKQIRKRYETKKEADAIAHSYALKMNQKECTPLDPEIHQVAALFQDKLSATQFLDALTEAVHLKGLSLRTLKELGEEFVAHQQTLKRQPRPHQGTDY